MNEFTSNTCEVVGPATTKKRRRRSEEERIATLARQQEKLVSDGVKAVLKRDPEVNQIQQSMKTVRKQRHHARLNLNKKWLSVETLMRDLREVHESLLEHQQSERRSLADMIEYRCRLERRKTIIESQVRDRLRIPFAEPPAVTPSINPSFEPQTERSPK